MVKLGLMPKLTSCGKSGAFRLYDKAGEHVATFKGRSEVCGSPAHELQVPFGNPVPTEDTWFCEACLKIAAKFGDAAASSYPMVTETPDRAMPATP